MLKPIPQEPHQGATPAKIKNKTRANFLRVQMTLPKVEKREMSIFALAIGKIANFMKKAENISLHELNELIHNLQRTVLRLEKKRIDLIRQAQRKKKK